MSRWRAWLRRPRGAGAAAGVRARARAAGSSDAAGAARRGRAVLVTGAASGIGRATAQLFAEEGDCVALLDVDAAGLAATLASLPDPRRHLAVPVDIADAAAVGEAFDRVYRALGALDVTVLAAGVAHFPDAAPIEGVTEESWGRLLDVNLHGTFRTLRAAFAITARRSTSSIVTVASVAALVGQDRLYAYTASKGGLLALSRTMAIEAGRSGVRVNCVCPGAIRTPMIEAHLDDGAVLGNLLDRPGLPEEVAVVVHGLCDPGAGFLTGATITVDGGATAI